MSSTVRDEKTASCCKNRVGCQRKCQSGTKLLICAACLCGLILYRFPRGEAFSALGGNKRLSYQHQRQPVDWNFVNRKEGNSFRSGKLCSSQPLVSNTAKFRALKTSLQKSKDASEEILFTKANGSTGGRSLSKASVPPREPFRAKAYILTLSAIIGGLSGLNIAVFKRLVDLLRDTCYGNPFVSEHIPLLFIPALGGLAVGVLVLLGGEFPPGLRQTIEELDADVLLASGVEPPIPGSNNNCYTKEERNDVARFARKGLGAVCTLGTGNSLGPEGPAVEAGMSVSRLCTSVVPPSFLFGKSEISSDAEGQDGIATVIARNRLLLSCGAAAGMSAGFNAPLSGVFFALEIVQGALPPFNIPRPRENDPLNGQNGEQEFQRVGQESLASESISISAILLSSVIAALVSKIFLGNELALHLSSYELKNPLIELPLYLLLGVMAGVVSSFFSGVAQLSKAVFAGTAGSQEMQKVFLALPKWSKPFLGSVICGVVGLAFPQILFFGYETLNGLLASETFPTVDVFVLLGVKTFTTAVAAASGLVGGTFAPSLFLGGMLGAGFHNIAAGTLTVAHDTFPMLDNVSVELSELPAYAMVGAASVLAALFRAPLTASLLLFECTRDYDVILPLMASAGVGSLVGDVIENALEEQRRDVDSVSWGDLAMRNEEPDDDECDAPLESEENELVSFR